jgi:hypothetical protein
LLLWNDVGWLKHSNGDYECEWGVRLPVLSAIGFENQTIFGFTNAHSGPTDCILFYIDHTRGAQFYAVIKVANASTVTSLSTLGLTANTWARVKVIVYASGTAEVFVDDVSAGSIGSLPSVALFPVADVINAGGAVTFHLHIDWAGPVKQALTVPR